MRLATGRWQRGRIGAARRRRIAILGRAMFLGVAVVAGCGGKLIVLDAQGGPGRFRHRELGYEIDFPSVLGAPGWSTGHLEGSDFLVGHRDGSVWTLASHCRRTATPIGLLGAELARAARDADPRMGAPLAQAGLEGWVQQLETPVDGASWQIKTVTLRGARCVYDWILMAPARPRLEELELPFDAWWQSFEPGPAERGEARREGGQE